MFDVIMPLLIAGASLYWIVRARITGVASVGDLEFERHQEPATYWGVLVFYTFIVVLGCWLAATA